MDSTRCLSVIICCWQESEAVDAQLEIVWNPVDSTASEVTGRA
ncbi:hypothetical protein WP1_094 [Pseudomonas phage WP1]